MARLSAGGAAALALTIVVLLGALAAWLLNVPPWLVAGGTALLLTAGLVRLVRRARRQLGRQKAEDPAPSPKITNP